MACGTEGSGAAGAVGVVEVEIEIEQFLFADCAGPGVFEVEFIEQAERGFAFHEGVERDLQELVLAAELNGGLHERSADAAAARIGPDAEAADLADAGIDVLD